MIPREKQFRGMKAFAVVWIGQFISILGSSMTGFAMTIWAYEKTGRATDLALVGFFWMMPIILLSPITGAIVDRYNRKLMMIVSDFISVLATISFLILNLSGKLEIWHLYVGVTIISIFQTVQWPAYSVAMTLMIPKEQYTRANSLLELAGSGSNIIAPMLAGALLPLIRFNGIMTIDIITATLAVGSLFFIFIPEPKESEEGKQGKGNLLQEGMQGFKYVFKRPSLVWLQGVFMVGNFVAHLSVNSLMAPMILARTGNNELVYGSVQTIASIGSLIGSLAIGAWGGFKRRIHGVIIGWGAYMFSIFLFGFGRATPSWMSIPIWGGAMFLGAMIGALSYASNQSIWQAKVPADMQGRVFSVRRLLAWFMNPLATLIAGPLADNLMEPAMAEGGSLTSTFGWLVGTGPGAGMALIFIFSGLVGTILIFSGYLIKPLREIESILPDHDDSLADMMVEPEAEPALAD